MKKALKVLFVLSLLCFSVVSVHATPIQWTFASGGNDHWYEVISTKGTQTPNKNWYEAYLAANAAAGYLATITTKEENFFISGLIADPNYWGYNGQDNALYGPWIGGYQPEGSNEPGEGWDWVGQEVFGYTHWDSNSPNDNSTDQGQNGEGQNVAHFLILPDAREGRTGVPIIEDFESIPTDGYLWNDLNWRNTLPSYIIEYNSNPVPEPTTIVLLGFGLVGLAGVARKKMKK